MAANALEMDTQLCRRRFRQHRDSVSITLPSPHDELLHPEVDVLDPQPRTLEQPQPGAIEQDDHETRGPLEPFDHRAHLVARQHDGQTTRPTCPHHLVESFERHAEDVAIQEQQPRKCLILRRRTHLPLDGEPREEPRHLLDAELPRMALAVKQDVSPDPADVRLLGPPAHVPDPSLFAHSIEQTWRPAR